MDIKILPCRASLSKRVVNMIIVTMATSMPLMALSQETLSQKADNARKESRKLEQSQLDKARAATSDTRQREAKILKKHNGAEWQQEQRDKAQSHFDERAKREQKYLKEAHSAAKKPRKILKSSQEK